MSSSPRVSVLMTVWNGAKYIAESIESILRQTFEDFEFIIIDDGSTDTTCEVIESFHDPRIRLIRRPHEGVIAAANFGAAQARGFYIARLDADDISLPERLALQVAALDKNPRAVLCYTDMTSFGDNSFGDTGPAHKSNRFCLDTAFINVIMCQRTPFAHSSLVVRKDAFDRIGGYVKYPCEDFDLDVRLIREGPFVGIPLKLLRYRRHPESATYKRLEELARLAREISLEHIRYFLKVGSPQDEAIFHMLTIPPVQRKWSVWFFFCRKVLSHPECWRPEPLGYLVLHTLKKVARVSHV